MRYFVLVLFLFQSFALFGQGSLAEFEKGKSIALSQPDSAYNFFERAVNLAKKEGNDTLLALSLHEWGKTAYETSRYSVSFNAYEEAKEILERNNRQKDLAELELSYGTLYLKLGDHELASRNILSAKRRFGALNDFTGELLAENAMGILYFEKGDMKRARKIFSELREITPHNDPSLEDLHGNMAILFFYTNELDSALWYFKSSQQYSMKENNTDKVAVGYNNIAHVYQMKNMQDSALANFERSLSLYRSIESSAGICLVLGGIAQVFHKKKEYTKAREYYLQSLEISTRLGLKNFAEHSSIRLARLEAETGNFQKAYESLTLHLSYRDSTQSEKSNRLIEEMQARFNVEKKEAQIDSLQQQQLLSSLELKAQEEEAQRKSYLIYGLFLIVVLILSFGYFLYKALVKNKENNQLLTIRNHEIAQQNKEIKDSIRYAKHIQEAILPPDSFIQKVFPHSFIFYKPKDIVSGDFYWVEEVGQKVLFATVDCTGHGVPGAFMSIVAHNGLLQAINVHGMTRPAEILNFLSVHVNEVLRQNSENSTIRDGMDISLCALDPKSGKLEFAGANHPLIIYKKEKDDLLEIRADKQPIGNFAGYHPKPFTQHELQLEKDDTVYLFSDGYSDQFGGLKGKKLKYAQFKALIKKATQKTMKDQGKFLEQEFENWRGSLEQLDDICVFGVRY